MCRHFTDGKLISVTPNHINFKKTLWNNVCYCSVYTNRVLFPCNSKFELLHRKLLDYDNILDVGKFWHMHSR